MTNKPDFCRGCPINHVTTGYVPLQTGPSTTLVVGEAAGEEEAGQGKPFVGGAGGWLNSMLKSARLERSDLNIINVLGCRPPNNVFPSSREWSATSHADGHAGVRYCYAHHLAPVLMQGWRKIIALGNEALRATTGQDGILRWRGSPLPIKLKCDCNHRDVNPKECYECYGKGWYWSSEPRVLPTLHPAYLMRNASMFSTAVADLRKELIVPPENYDLYTNIDTLRKFDSRVFAFDLEWGEYGDITICGLSDGYYRCLVVDWKQPYLSELKRIFENATDLIGQNIIGADLKYLERMGWNIAARLHDIMLMHHLIMPDYRHDLGTISSQFSSKIFWKGKDVEEEEEDESVSTTGAQWKTWETSEAIPRDLGGYGGCKTAGEAFRLYNARDTDSSFQCYQQLSVKLRQYGLDVLQYNLSTPVAHECRRMADLGIKIDPSRVKEINERLKKNIAELEQKLPEGLKPYEQATTKNKPAPEGTFRPKVRTCKGSRKVPHGIFSRTFTSPTESTICERCGKNLSPGKMVEAKTIKVAATKQIIPWNSTQQVQDYATRIGCKQIINKKSGRATSDKNARKVWGRTHVEFTIVDQLKKYSTLRNNFAKEKLLQEERVYFNLLVHGTAEGRLSSSGKRRGIDPNIQNQPDDVRYIYVPDHSDWGILDVDWVQGENMLTAHLAGDAERMARLMTPGYDEHSALASEWFQCTVTKKNENAYLRDAGKIMNHGLNYGAGPFKIQELLAINGFNYPIADVKAGIEGWRRINKGTYEWQQRTTRIAEAQGYLINPFGRRRWFQSRDYSTKALAFLPASTLADMMLRCMIALYPNKYPTELATLGVMVTGVLPNGWDTRWQVHDSLVLQGPHVRWKDALDVVRLVMTQRWPQLDGFGLQCSAKYSTVSWGDCEEVD